VTDATSIQTRIVLLAHLVGGVLHDVHTLDTPCRRPGAVDYGPAAGSVVDHGGRIR
jgi:hypothetical protein